MAAQYDLGFLGGGQLARMSIQAAQRMGLRCVSLDPSADSPAAQISDSRVGSLDSPDDLATILSLAERVTFENEFIPAAALREAVQRAGRSEDVVIPGIDALATIQDKLHQRKAYRAAGVPSPRAVALSGGDEVAELGFPCVLKARFGGYDGKGTRYARTAEEYERHRDLWSAGGWLAEEFVPFRRELAVMVSLSPDGASAWPTMETRQVDHVCDLVLPCDTDAGEIAIRAARAVASVGLFGVELFELPDGQILVNEIAPRPHNTGHYTLDWGGASQFEQHVRLALGLTPRTDLAGRPTCMANLLGQPDAVDFRNGVRAALASDASASVHWYGKAQAKPGRKMGHLNVSGESGGEIEALVNRAVAARSEFYRSWSRP